ncbi:hypothetical protein BCV69DRAFT_107221 [Microstroma glucosiphilum]|uniref:RlpA-like protein double-psi beta-barrel domain-containing protein n=1 Tax=Pseudomicrostroma glucosiphilum TaxID=1684307 RepID=A0A316UCW2_9BASI|nr:hypothetical protein BCV69DRAFT_107221 [Pseudomicrostroma glucosiphilum]PWN23077.1 hypothetical protein BCV69DRAFT_107221 [Pseudomicrostroma glucosiphilum]
MANMKNKRSLLALVALALCSAILLCTTPASASPRSHLATSKHSAEFAQQVRDGQEKRLVGELPIVGDLTKELPIPMKREQNKRLVGDLPIVGDLTKDLPVPLKREEKRLVGDLPVVGDLTKELPVPLKRGEKRLVGGLPVVGDLTKDLPIPLKRQQEKRLVGDLLGGTSSEKNTPLVDALVGDHLDLNALTARDDDDDEDDEPLIDALVADHLNLNALTARDGDDDDESLIDGLIGDKLNLNALTARDDEDEEDEPLIDALVGDHLNLNALTARDDEEDDDESLIDTLVGDKLNLNALTARTDSEDKPLIDAIVGDHLNLNALTARSDSEDKPLIDAIVGDHLNLNVLTDSHEKRLIGNALDSLPLVGGKSKATDSKASNTTADGVAPASTASAPVAGKGVAGLLPIRRSGMLGSLTDSLPTKSVPIVGGLLPVRRASDYAEYDTLSERDTIDLAASSGAEKRSQHMGGGKLTWFAGHEMDAPACGGPKPNDGSFIVAVNEKLKGHCGKTVRLSHGGKTLNAKVVDWCGNCPIRHLDASKAVFGYFADLSQGEVHGMDFTFVGDDDPEAHKLGPLDVSVQVHHHHS